MKKISFGTEKYGKILDRMGMKRVGTSQQLAAPAARSDAEGGFFIFAVRKTLTNWSKFTNTVRFPGSP